MKKGKKIRIIPRLDIKGPNVVKGIHFEGLRVLGTPASLVTQYYMEGADEILYMDIVASLYGRSIDLDQLKHASEGIFIPITVGGGIRSVNDINNVLRSGADKVAINTYATSHPEFLKEAVETFGAQAIVLSVEAKKQPDGGWEAYTDGGRERTGRNVIKWIREAISMGVGEVIISSIDRDGTRKGYDLDLVEIVTDFVPVPVIVHGGAGTLDSILEVTENGKVDAVSASSIFQYNDYKIRDVKSFLSKKSVRVRLP